MALCGMAVHDSVENRRTWLTAICLSSWAQTVDPNRHRLVVVDNASCEATKELLRAAGLILPGIEVVTNAENVGTARAVNQVWERRRLGENCLKVDNDVLWHDAGWLDRLEACVVRDPAIGIIGLKRKDVDERVGHPDPQYASELVQLPHEKGQDWLVVEKANHVMGTCQLYSAALLDKIGFLYQLGGRYGFDDSLAAARCKAAGFYSCFDPVSRIDHPDPGRTTHQTWKQAYARERMLDARAVGQGYLDGLFEPYHGPADEQPTPTFVGVKLFAEWTNRRLTPIEAARNHYRI